IGPGSMIEMKMIDNNDLDCYLLFVSTDFMHDINFDLNVLSTTRPLNLSNHSAADRVMHITSDEAAGLREYFSLLHRNSSDVNNSLYTKAIARNLIAALTYQVLSLVTRRHKDTSENKPQRSRRTTYVSEFMQLVHEHHIRERSVAFYAGKLFISPKYLSLIIKETTGRSATEVIDSFVILEAKNLLRFSGKNIQQVAYELNFPNQSSFGKYFKHLTGMSPSEYQRS
ncbi:MAG: helix-turn-helix domain-containing protein, partial [Duncaniella sp.]|nr:helix-turn-helix domain-containing protein [Duncaniella sp.]